MGGGGKRDAHSHEHYDRETGIAVFTSPSVKPGQWFLYFDPLESLAPDIQARWEIATERRAMIDDALREAGAGSGDPVACAVR
jgi:lysine 2,3-aminomutase